MLADLKFTTNKLATKFTFILSVVFLTAIIISGIALSKALEHRAEDEINYRGQVLMEMVNAVRDYTDNNIGPLLIPHLDNQTNFIAETVPSFSSREVFENFRKHSEYNNFLYKDATLNPTNLRDKADEFESSLVEKFRNEDSLGSTSGFRTMFGENLFYTARPLKIEKESCLRCHSTPEAAPKSLVETYGRDNGFGWNLNEVIGTQVIYIPAKQVMENAHQAFSLVIAIFLIIFTVVILFINTLLKHHVIKPIQPMAQLAQKISNDSIHADTKEEAVEIELQQIATVVKRQDELGQLGRLFQRMVREIYAREQRLKQQVQELQIEIDQTKLHRQVSDIAQSDYFQKLKKEAKDIRKKWSGEN